VIVTDIGDRHFHPRAEQGLGDAKPDAAGAAGNEGGLAFQILHVTLR
jgi:hypothetical protein